jgi:hypothetical protein
VRATEDTERHALEPHFLHVHEEGWLPLDKGEVCEEKESINDQAVHTDGQHDFTNVSNFPLHQCVLVCDVSFLPMP